MAFAFAIAQATLTAALFAAMLIAIPRRREVALARVRVGERGGCIEPRERGG